MNFRTRIWQTELMDGPGVGPDQLKEVFKDINRSNKLLGGDKSSLKVISSLIKESAKKKISVLDIGCGDGQFLRKLALLNRSAGVESELYGVDNNSEAIAIAREHSKDYPEIQYIYSDILDADDNIPVCDLIISALTMHHISDQDIPRYLNRCSDLASSGIVINDLHRSRLAYYLFMIFSSIFIRSSIAKQDGLVSIRKGFRKKELVAYSDSIKSWRHTIQWKWAFRYVWVMNRDRL